MDWKRNNYLLRTLVILLIFFGRYEVLLAQEYEESVSESYDYSEPDNAQYDYAASELSGIEADENLLKERAMNHRYEDRITPEKPTEKTEKSPDTPEPVISEKRIPSFWSTANGQTLAYILAFTALVAILIYLFFNLKKQTSEITETDLAFASEGVSREMLHKLDIDAALEDALEHADYRLALRFLYLKNLKLMMSRGWIFPSPEKTNQDYIHEISEPVFREEWTRITGIFERIWYGNRLPDKAFFADYRNELDNYFNKVRLR